MEKELEKLGFIRTEEKLDGLTLVSFDKKIDDERTLVIVPQLQEVFVWFEVEGLKIYLDRNVEIEKLIEIAEYIIGVE